MKQTARIISIYASDTSGVCSMLFELGGMIIVHDASGCNSTYTTHDEPRWYSGNGMIFISALTEMDAIMGNDSRLIDDAVRAAEELKPRFIAICGSPMPMMIGTDFEAVAREIEERSGLPVLPVRTNGMATYLDGASSALCAYLKRFCRPEKKQPGTVNIIGATPLDFSLNGSVESISSWLEKNGFRMNSCMAMGSSPERIAAAGCASVNLVISSCGMAAAEYMKQEYGIPWVTGVPFGTVFPEELLSSLKYAESSGEPVLAHLKRRQTGKCEIGIIGEPVSASSLAAAAEREFSVTPRILCPDSLFSGNLLPDDLRIECEDSLRETMKEFSVVIADPLYEPIIPRETKLIRYPHEAFSGRCFAKDIPNMVDRKLKQEFFGL